MAAVRGAVYRPSAPPTAPTFADPAADSVSPAERTELDDLLDELLRDAAAVVRPPSRPRSTDAESGISGSGGGGWRGPAPQPCARQDSLGALRGSKPASPATSITGVRHPLQLELDTDLDEKTGSARIMDGGWSPFSGSPASSVYSGYDSRSATKRSRLPSLPESIACTSPSTTLTSLHHGYHHQPQPQDHQLVPPPIPPAPTNYQYFDSTPRAYHSDGGIIDDPTSWLERQKFKLQTRMMDQQRGGILQRSGVQTQSDVQHRLLIDELKSAQTLMMMKRADREANGVDAAESGTGGVEVDKNVDDSVASSSPASTTARTTTTASSSDTNNHTNGDGDRGNNKKTPQNKLFSAESTSTGSRKQGRTFDDGKNVDAAAVGAGSPASKNQYYVCGLERPPFTTHQTQYLFSVSPPLGVSHHHVPAASTSPLPAEAAALRRRDNGILVASSRSPANVSDVTHGGDYRQEKIESCSQRQALQQQQSVGGAGRTGQSLNVVAPERRPSIHNSPSTVRVRSPTRDNQQTPDTVQQSEQRAGSNMTNALEVGELLVLQPIGRGIVDMAGDDVTRRPTALSRKYEQSDRSGARSATRFIKSQQQPNSATSHPRSRSVETTGSLSLQYPVLTENKLRPITPVTYTNLGEWQRGKQEVYIINDIMMTPELSSANEETPVAIRRPRPMAFVPNDDVIASKSEYSKKSDEKQNSGTTEDSGSGKRQHSRSSSGSSSKHHRHRRHRKHGVSSLQQQQQQQQQQVDDIDNAGQVDAVSPSVTSKNHATSESVQSPSTVQCKTPADNSCVSPKYTNGHRRNHVSFTNQPTDAADSKKAAVPTPTSPSFRSIQLSPTSPVSFPKSIRTPSPLADTLTRIQSTPCFVHDSSKLWHKPRISRDEAVNFLKNKPPGSFVIRNSNSFPGAFGLALKVSRLPPNVHAKGNDPQADLVRHFLIEPTPKGVRLKGCSSEPVFASLAALVYQHSLTPLSLPCKLIIPEAPDAESEEDVAETGRVSSAQQILNQGAACSVLYITTMDTECLTGPEAVTKSIDFAVRLSPAPKTTVVHFKVSSLGITLTDLKHRLFFRRHYPIATVTFCGLDPDDRRWSWLDEHNQLPCSARMFGFVAKRLGGGKTDNACHVFAELDAEQPAAAIVNFIMKVMIGRGQKRA